MVYAELASTRLQCSFDSLMAAQVRATAEEVATGYDWSSVTDVVDVGGGTGLMLRTLLAAHPHLRGTLFGLPQVVGGIVPAERLRVVAGNVFRDPLPPADAYVLSQVLHGWADEASFDLFMLTLSGGRQRSLDDFGRLAEQ